MDRIARRYVTNVISHTLFLMHIYMAGMDIYVKHLESEKKN